MLAGTTTNTGNGGGCLVEPAKQQFKVIKGKPGSTVKEGVQTTFTTGRPPTASKSNAAGGTKSKSALVDSDGLSKEQLIPDDSVESQLIE